MSVRCFVVSAVLAGFVPAGQGSEQAAQNPREAIVPMGVTTSSTQTESKSPQKLIDGWGLAEPGVDGSWCHTSNAFRYQGVERGSMWSSGDVGGRRDLTPTLTFDLGKHHRVGSVRIWNYNEANWTSVGLKEVEFSSSLDGQNFSPLGVTVLEQAPGDDDYSGQAVSLQKAVETRYVRLHGLSHWGGERCGLSEIRFFASGAGAAGAIATGVRPAVRTAQGPEPNRPNPPRPAVPGAENIVFPVNAGIIDVTAAPYNAQGDGKTDDTRAIQQALRDYADQGAIIYLPNGTYRISKTLRWGTNQKLTTLQGQSRAGTILRLPDACPGFTDPGQPAAMVWTGDMPAQRFRNQIRNCTWDTGKGNPGAIGVRFNASNCGCLRDVAVRSGDGTGVIGLDLSYTDDYGPFFVKNVSVEGFDTGIATKHGVNSVVFEYVTLRGQRKVGWHNNGHPITVRGLVSENAVTAFCQEQWGGFLTLIDAKLTGTGAASGLPAIRLSAGGLLARNVAAPGYASAIHKETEGRRETVPGPLVDEWASARLPGSGPKTLGLPVKETPEVPWDDPQQWAVITDFGAKVDGHTDDSDALQRAIDSGQTTVCLPRGVMILKKPVVLRGHVRRLIGCETFVKFPVPMAGAGSIFTVGESTEPVLVVERFASWFWDNASGLNFIDNPTQRTLVLKDLSDLDDTTDRRPNGRGTVINGPGELFVEDVAGRFHLRPGVRAWMRYVNPETNQDHRNTRPDAQWHLRNDGGQLWILGIKTEGPGPVLLARQGSRTELLGGLMYSSGGARTQEQPAFVIEDSQASLSITEANFSNNAYQSLVQLKKHGATVFELRRGQTPGSAGGSLIPLWSTP